MVVEDDPYGRLRYGGGHVLPLKALSDDVVYLGTVSKVFAPGLRTGWIVAPKSVLAKINLVKQGTDLCGSAFNQVVVEHYFTDTPWQKTLQKFVKTYRTRRDAMLAREEAQRLANEADQALAQKGKQLEKDEKKQIKADVAAVRKLLSKKVNKVDEADVAALRAAAAQLERSSARARDLARQA